MPKRQFYSKGASKFNKTEKFRSNDPGLSRDSKPDAKRPKTESEKPAVDGTKKTDNEGNAFWEIGGKLRRATVSEFKGNVLISIREYYEKDGQAFPGKKGISLTMEQYNNLLALAPQIEVAAKAKGAKDTVRPVYADEVEKSTPKKEQPPKKIEDSEESDEDEDDEEEEGDVDEVD